MKTTYLITLVVFVLFLGVSISILAQTPYTITAKNQAGQIVTNVTQGQTYTIIATGQITGQGVIFSLYTRDNQNNILTTETRNATPPSSCTETACSVSYTIPTTSGTVSFTAQVEDSATTWTVISSGSTPTPTPSPTPTTTPSPSPTSTPSPTNTATVTSTPVATSTPAVTSTPVPTPVAVAGCTDSDGSYGDQSVYAIGSTQRTGQQKPDICVDEKIVEEYSCNSNGEIVSQRTVCLLGCTKGACIAPEGQCLGSREPTPYIANTATLFSSLTGTIDGDKTVYTNTLSPTGVKYEDYCADSQGNLNPEDVGTHVSEYVCKKDNTGFDKVVTECKWGCNKGACNNVADKVVCVQNNGGVSLLKSTTESTEPVEINDVCFGLNLTGGLKDSIVKASCNSNTQSLALLPATLSTNVGLVVNSGSADKVLDRKTEKCQLGCKTYSDGRGECLQTEKGPTFYQEGSPNAAGLVPGTIGKQIVGLLFNMPVFAY